MILRYLRLLPAFLAFAAGLRFAGWSQYRRLRAKWLCKTCLLEKMDR